MLLIMFMLVVLFGFFGLLAGLVCFSQGVIEPEVPIIVSHLQRQRAEQEHIMGLYVLLALVVALVIYLFYAVIHPERF